MTLLELVQLIGAAISVFLIGANIGFLASVGQRVVPWFSLKIGAVTMLLGYICLSLTFGSPTMARSLFGLVGLLTDCAALFWMWKSIERLDAEKIVGLIPLTRPIYDEVTRR